jgi:hypothetical protein
MLCCLDNDTFEITHRPIDMNVDKNLKSNLVLSSDSHLLYRRRLSKLSKIKYVKMYKHCAMRAYKNSEVKLYSI